MNRHKQMRANEMREVLKSFPDFQKQRTVLEEYFDQHGHKCIFYPKFISPIERVRCKSKKHTHAYADGTITKLRKIVPQGLNSITLEQIKKFFRTCRDYERAYREGGTGKEVEKKLNHSNSISKYTTLMHRLKALYMYFVLILFLQCLTQFSNLQQRGENFENVVALKKSRKVGGI